jgi:hypothetical protein
MAKKRKGRPATQNVMRYACGKVRKEYAKPKGETEMAAMATVLAYRKRVMGLPEEDARRNEAGYELGRMMLRGQITSRQHRAGCDYALLVADYQRAIGFPPPYPQGMDLGAARGLSLVAEPDQVRLRRTVNQYMQSITAIADAGTAADRAVREACVYDREVKDVENLRLGLDALAAFFSIPLDA